MTSLRTVVQVGSLLDLNKTVKESLQRTYVKDLAFTDVRLSNEHNSQN